jgi:hypothetical protein
MCSRCSAADCTPGHHHTTTVSPNRATHQVTIGTAMQRRTIEEKVSFLMDRAEIADAIGCYTYGMDSRNWALFRTCWTDQISLDFTAIELITEPLTNISLDAYIELLKAFFEKMPRSQHLKAPVRYEFDGDKKATVYSMMQGKHWMPNSLGGPMQTVVGYYRDEFVRTKSGWKMCGMKELIYWNEGNGYVLTDNLQRMLLALQQSVSLPGHRA